MLGLSRFKVEVVILDFLSEGQPTERRAAGGCGGETPMSLLVKYGRLV